MKETAVFKFLLYSFVHNEYYKILYIILFYDRRLFSWDMGHICPIASSHRRWEKLLCCICSILTNSNNETSKIFKLRPFRLVFKATRGNSNKNQNQQILSISGKNNPPCVCFLIITLRQSIAFCCIHPTWFYATRVEVPKYVPIVANRRTPRPFKKRIKFVDDDDSTRHWAYGQCAHFE